MKALAQKHAIGKPGQQIVPGDTLKRLLAFLFRADVGEKGDVLLSISGLVADCRNGEHLGEDATVLGAIPDFSGPMTAFNEVAPHVGVELLALTA